MKDRWMPFSGSRGRGARILAVAVTLPMFAAATALAQTPQGPSSAPSASAAKSVDSMAIPSFWDPRRRPERPDLSRISIIRFLTETDYPPFNYAGPDGAPIGSNVDLARLICEELKVACTGHMRRFDTRNGGLQHNNGDALI